MIERLRRVPVLAAIARHADPVAAGVFLVGLELSYALSTVKRGPVAANVVVLAAMALLLLRRRRAPLTVVATAFGLALVQDAFLTHVPNLVAAIPYAMFVSYSLGVLTEGARSTVVFVFALGVMTTLSIAQSGLKDVVFPDVFFFVLPWIAGRAMRSRLLLAREVAERTARLEVNREERARQAVRDERARIARELHDVVAHSLTVMVIQASAAQTMVDRDPARVADIARTIKRTGREALDEMRRLVGVITPEGEAPALAPQPSMADVDALLERTRAAGLETELRVEGERPALPGGIDLAAYRVIQEALTNTIKHARASRAKVSVTYGDTLEIVISDDGTNGGSAAANVGGGGHGLVGMRERVRLYGGALESGPAPGGGYEVRVRIPLVAEGAVA